MDTLTITGGNLVIPQVRDTKFLVQLNQNVTSVSFANNDGKYGYLIELHFVQDATGGRTVTGWPSTVNFTSTFAVSAAPNSRCSVSLRQIANPPAATIYDEITRSSLASGGGGLTYTDEQAQDAAAALFGAGTHVGISFVYDDAGNRVSATVAPAWTSVTGRPTLAPIATTGSAADITTGTLADSVIPGGIARQSYVQAQVAALVNAAPSTLDTLGEIAAQLAADESGAATLTSQVAGKAQALTPTTAFTSSSHTPASGEYARYSPSSPITPALPVATAGQRFGVVNIGTSTVTLTCSGSDTFGDGSTTLLLNPAERAVLLGTGGAFHFESRYVVVSKTSLGLDQVSNTSDAAKPISAAQQAGLDLKVDKSTLTAKGDLYAATASGTVARVPVGSIGQVLTADTGAAAGMSWQTPPAGGGGATPNRALVLAMIGG